MEPYGKTDLPVINSTVILIFITCNKVYNNLDNSHFPVLI